MLQEHEKNTGQMNMQMAPGLETMIHFWKWKSTEAHMDAGFYIREDKQKYLYNMIWPRETEIPPAKVCNLHLISDS